MNQRILPANTENIQNQVASVQNMTQELRFQFFDTQLQVRSDSARFLSLVAHLHKDALVQSWEEYPQQRLTFELYCNNESNQHAPLISLNGETYSLGSTCALYEHAYLQMLQLVTQSVRSHIFIHAGAVCYEGKGVILVADSMHGKTTLVLELIRRGFRFLSDDIAALDRSDAKVHPFPRVLSIRPRSLEVLNLPNPSEFETWQGKLLVDLDTIYTERKGDPVPVRHIITMVGQNNHPESAHHGDESRLRFVFERIDDDLLSALEQIKNIAILNVDILNEHPVIDFSVKRKLESLREILELCQERGVLVLDYVTREVTHPEFKSPARLEKYPRSQATMDLVRNFHVGHTSAIFQSEGSSSLQLFMELATFTADADCHRLHVGSVAQNADLICGLLM